MDCWTKIKPFVDFLDEKYSFCSVTARDYNNIKVTSLLDKLPCIYTYLQLSLYIGQIRETRPANYKVWRFRKALSLEIEYNIEQGIRQCLYQVYEPFAKDLANRFRLTWLAPDYKHIETIPFLYSKRWSKSMDTSSKVLKG